MSIISEAFEEENQLNPDYPVRCGYDVKSFTFPPHYHRGIEIVYVTNGTMPVEVNGQTYRLTAGDLLIIGSHHIHSYQANEEAPPAAYYLMILDWQYLKDLPVGSRHYERLAPVLLQTNCIHTSEDSRLLQEIPRLMADLNQEFALGDVTGELMVLSDFYRLLTLAARHLKYHESSPQDTRQVQKSYDTIRRINRLIYSNYTQEITLSEAAKIAGYSTYHFTRIFKGLTGTTFKTYLTDFRLNMVKEALRSTDLPITDLALANGFNSLKTFNRNFLSATGITPTQFRNRNF